MWDMEGKVYFSIMVLRNDPSVVYDGIVIWMLYHIVKIM